MYSSNLDSIVVDGAEASRRLVDQVLNDQAGAARDIVLLNAGAAIYIGGKAGSHADGVSRAREALASGAARQVLEYRTSSRRFLSASTRRLPSVANTRRLLCLMSE